MGRGIVGRSWLKLKLKCVSPSSSHFIFEVKEAAKYTRGGLTTKLALGAHLEEVERAFRDVKAADIDGWVPQLIRDRKV